MRDIPYLRLLDVPQQVPGGRGIGSAASKHVDDLLKAADLLRSLIDIPLGDFQVCLKHLTMHSGGTLSNGRCSFITIGLFGIQVMAPNSFNTLGADGSACGCWRIGRQKFQPTTNRGDPMEPTRTESALGGDTLTPYDFAMEEVATASTRLTQALAAQ